MNGLEIKSIVSKEMARSFDLVDELVRSCIFYRVESPETTGLLDPADLSVTARALFVDYHSQDIDGSSVLVGDEKCFVIADELGQLVPGAGDYLVEVLSGIRRNIIAARKDPTDAFWILQVRRFFNEDWGDLSRPSALEDWGNLTAATQFDDWQAN
jgi:hypothetical protein